MSNTDVWVGSWRPHKPRGTIAALYSSPGPKYALPGITGMNCHDPCKWKAPAYSFGSHHRQFSSSCSPGPGYLIPSNITRVGRDGTPAYSLCSRPKVLQRFKTPGPGQYCPEKAGKTAYYSAPAYSLGTSSRNKTFYNAQTPGPAAYMLPSVLGPNTVNKRSAPNFSLVGRSKIGSFQDLQKTPGPASYKAVDINVYRSKPPNYSMTGRNSMPGDKTKKPGPGAHRPEQAGRYGGEAPINIGSKNWEVGRFIRNPTYCGADENCCKETYGISDEFSLQYPGQKDIMVAHTVPVLLNVFPLERWGSCCG